MFFCRIFSYVCVCWTLFDLQSHFEYAEASLLPIHSSYPHSHPVSATPAARSRILRLLMVLTF